MKKKIKIAHLYYDLMNLYGENGNIRALENFIARQGFDAYTDRLTIKDKIDFKKYDIYYLGAGSEENELLVIADLLPYKEDIKTAIEDGKMFLVTGNAMEIFGREIYIPGTENIECLGIFNYTSVYGFGRLVGEVQYEFAGLPLDKGRHIVGFKNCNSQIVENDGELLFGTSDSFRQNNFFAMNFIGPILIRNPYFTDYLLSILFEELHEVYVADSSTCEYKAYHEYVKNFVEPLNLD